MIADKLHYTEYIKPSVFILLQYRNQRMLWDLDAEWTLVWFIVRDSCFKINSEQSSNRIYYSSVISENEKQAINMKMNKRNQCNKIKSISL
jgi:hypothetical protein